MNRRSTLVILLAICERTLETFEERDDPVDPELVADLERVVERTRREIAALRPRTAQASK